MSDWLHDLPVPVMALVIFGFTYLLDVGDPGVRRRARGAAGAAKSFKAISVGMLPALGIIFGLFVAFTAAQVWSDNDRASAAISREASALRSMPCCFGASLPARAGGPTARTGARLCASKPPRSNGR